MLFQRFHPSFWVSMVVYKASIWCLKDTCLNFSIKNQCLWMNVDKTVFSVFLFVAYFPFT